MVSNYDDACIVTRHCCGIVFLQKKMMTSRFESMIPRESHDPMSVRPCELCDGGEDLRPRKSGVHSLRLHRRRLFPVLATDHLRAQVYLTFLASMAVHVCLQRTGSSKPLVAHFALVLLLRAARQLGIELTHHGLGRRW